MILPIYLIIHLRFLRRSYVELEINIKSIGWYNIQNLNKIITVILESKIKF